MIYYLLTCDTCAIVFSWKINISPQIFFFYWFVKCLLSCIFLGVLVTLWEQVTIALMHQKVFNYDFLLSKKASRKKGQRGRVEARHWTYWNIGIFLFTFLVITFLRKTMTIWIRYSHTSLFWTDNNLNLLKNTYTA